MTRRQQSESEGDDDEGDDENDDDDGDNDDDNDFYDYDFLNYVFEPFIRYFASPWIKKTFRVLEEKKKGQNLRSNLDFGLLKWHFRSKVKMNHWQFWQFSKKKRKKKGKIKRKSDEFHC